MVPKSFKPGPIIAGEVATIARKTQRHLQLGDGAERDVQKASELCTTTFGRALSDIRYD
jgi:hypothetical protein